MCSSRCDTPVIPVCSLREPTRYQTWKLTTGAECTSFVSTFSPLGRMVSWTPDSDGVDERALGVRGTGVVRRVWGAADTRSAAPVTRPAASKKSPKERSDISGFLLCEL